MKNVQVHSPISVINIFKMLLSNLYNLVEVIKYKNELQKLFHLSIIHLTFSTFTI